MKSKQQEEAANLTGVVDRRGEARHPPYTEPTFVWVSLQHRIQAQLIDESRGGIGVQVPSADPFEIGFQVRVEFRQGRRTARIVYLEEFGEAYRMGLAWE